MKKLLLTSITLFFLITSKVYGTGVEHDRGIIAYESGDYINAYMWLSITPVPSLSSTLIMEELKNKLTSKDISLAKKLAKEIKAKEANKNRAKEEKAKEKRAKEAGYSSYAVMQAEKKKKADAERERKRKADAERERKRKADAKKAAEKAKKTIIQARIDSKDNPGFRDLKPGMPYDDYMAICPRVRCYGIDNIKFSKQTSRESGVILISKIELDMGPITSDGLFLDIVNDLIESDSNIYRKMKRTMDTKYALDFEFSERDRQLFNEKEKRELLVAYSNGQVVLKINRRKKENSYSEDLWLYIEYRDVKSGKLFLKRNRPVAANLSDF